MYVEIWHLSSLANRYLGAQHPKPLMLLDTVNHLILLECLKNWFFLSGTALDWFKSYLKDWDFYLSVGKFKSDLGFPKGPIWGPSYSISTCPLILEKLHIFHDFTKIMQGVKQCLTEGFGTFLTLHVFSSLLNYNYQRLTHQKYSVVIGVWILTF